MSKKIVADLTESPRPNITQTQLTYNQANINSVCDKVVNEEPLTKQEQVLFNKAVLAGLKNNGIIR